MKLARVFLACALLPACATKMPDQPPGMPLDKKLLQDKPEEALTAVSTAR